MTNTNVDLTLIEVDKLRRFANEVLANVQDAETVIKDFIKWGIIDKLDDVNAIYLFDLTIDQCSNLYDPDSDHKIVVGKIAKAIVFMHIVLPIFKDKRRTLNSIRRWFQVSPAGLAYHPERAKSFVSVMELHRDNKRYNSDAFKRAILGNIYISTRLDAANVVRSKGLSLLIFKSFADDIDIRQRIVDVIINHSVSFSDTKFHANAFMNMICKIPVNEFAVSGMGVYGLTDRVDKLVNIAMNLSYVGITKSSSLHRAKGLDSCKLFGLVLSYGIGLSEGFIYDAKLTISFILKKVYNLPEYVINDVIARISAHIADSDENVYVNYMEVIEFIRVLFKWVIKAMRHNGIDRIDMRDPHHPIMFPHDTLTNDCNNAFIVRSIINWTNSKNKNNEFIVMHALLATMKRYSEEVKVLLEDMPDSFSDDLDMAPYISTYATYCRTE